MQERAQLAAAVGAAPRGRPADHRGPLLPRAVGGRGGDRAEAPRRGTVKSRPVARARTAASVNWRRGTMSGELEQRLPGARRGARRAPGARHRAGGPCGAAGTAPPAPPTRTPTDARGGARRDRCCWSARRMAVPPSSRRAPARDRTARREHRARAPSCRRFRRARSDERHGSGSAERITLARARHAAGFTALLPPHASAAYHCT